MRSRISASLTRSLPENRYAAFLFAKSWKTGGNALARIRGTLFEQRSKSFAQALINELTVGEFSVDPGVARFFVGN
jgi:hypothetical protein